LAGWAFGRLGPGNVDRLWWTRRTFHHRSMVAGVMCTQKRIDLDLIDGLAAYKKH
jgi:hypothetical protein